MLPVEEAVARLTARAADRLGLTDRGRIAAGQRADLVLLDPALYVDTATYADPCRSPAGVERVWVRGEAVWRGGAPTACEAGRRRPLTPEQRYFDPDATGRDDRGRDRSVTAP